MVSTFLFGSFTSVMALLVFSDVSSGCFDFPLLAYTPKPTSLSLSL